MTTTPQAALLSDEDDLSIYEVAQSSYRRHKSGCRGQMISAADDFEWHLMRATEQAVIAKLQAATPASTVTIGASLLRKPVKNICEISKTIPGGCYCPPDSCQAPVIMGRQTPCLRTAATPAEPAQAVEVVLDELAEAASTAYEAMEKHRQRTGEVPSGMLGVNAMEQLRGALKARSKLTQTAQAVELPDEREAFEAWAQKRLQLNIERCAPPEQGFYTWQSTMDAWMAWQARAALSATQPAQAAQGEPVARWITHARL